MDTLKQLQQYVLNALQTAPDDMKVLLLDDETTSIIALAFSQSEILPQKVYLFEKISQPNRESMLYLHAFCFLRPTEQSVEELKKELRDPKYGKYSVFFTNSVSTDYLREIAHADELELVHDVQEFYVDYYAVNPDAWHLNLRGPSVSDANHPRWPASLARITDGLAACLLALKVRPVIRVQKTSSLAKQVGQAIKSRTEHPSFQVGQPKSHPPLLLIMDRCEDPITPLLTAWTYQAMLHQLLDMHNNRIDLSNAPNISDDLKQVVVSCTQDEFYRQQMYANLGDLGEAIQKFVADFSKQSKNNSKLETLDDIKRFVEQYSDFKRTSGSVSKHVGLMTEIQRLIGQRKLLQVSAVEQDLACNDDLSAANENVRMLLQSPGIASMDALRVVLLYALRYANKSSSCMTEFVEILLRQYQLPKEQVGVIKLLREFAESSRRSASIDLFDHGSFFSSISKKVSQGLSGVQNIYTQHQPLLRRILTLARENRLETSAYEYLTGGPSKYAPTEIIIFVVGGITFEEAALIHNLRAEGLTCILGGTGFITPEEFIKQLRGEEPESAAAKSARSAKPKATSSGHMLLSDVI